MMRMMNDLNVRQCENGYIVYENNISNGYGSKSWVARSPEELGDLMERLAVEADKPQPQMQAMKQRAQ